MAVERRALTSSTDGAAFRGLALARYANVAGSTLVALTGALVLAGWLLDIPAFKSIFTQQNAMKPNTALALLALGPGALGARLGRWRLARRTAAVFVVAIGAVTFAEFAFAWDAHIDGLLIGVGAGDQLRMAPTTALCLVFLGLTVLLHGGHARPRVRLRDALVLASLVISYLAVIGYLYGASQLYGIEPSARMAMDTSVALLVAALALLALDADDGAAAILFRATAGGLVARRFIPLALLVIPALGWFRLAAQKAGWYDTEFGMALMVVTVAGLFIAATVRVAWILDHTHLRRVSAEVRATTDELTGLPNRRVVDAELARLDDIAARTGTVYSVLAIDLDELKRTNDLYGHATGDRAILHLADSLRAVLRIGDVAARIGGDEFLVLLPSTARHSAETLAERLRTVLRTTLVEPAVSASIGVSSWTPGLVGRALVADADQALYEQKATTHGERRARGGTPPVAR